MQLPFSVLPSYSQRAVPLFQQNTSYISFSLGIPNPLPKMQEVIDEL